MKCLIILAVTASLLAACSEQKQTPAYVSTLEFKDYNCKQIAKEMTHVSAQMNQAKSTSDMDAILSTGLMAYGMSQGMAVSTGEDDSKTEYLHARYEALHQASIKKDCD